MNGKKIPVELGLFNIPESSDEPVYLNGSRCGNCGRHFFPEVKRCALCSSEDLKSVKIGKKGKLYSFTNCNYPPPGGKYIGRVPFGLGLVALDEGIIIPARLTENDPKKLKAGMEVHLTLETLCKDNEGNDIVCFSYKPSEL